MIRKSKEQDIDQIVKIWYESNLTCHNFVEKAYWDQNYDMVREALLGGVTVFQTEGEILGFIGVYDGYIEGLFVDQAHRNKGVGKQLLNYAKKQYDELSLCAYVQNERAVHFYKREGFLIEEEHLNKETGCREYKMIYKGEN